MAETQTENDENEEFEDDNLEVMAPMIVQLQEDTVENEFKEFMVESPIDENLCELEIPDLKEAHAALRTPERYLLFVLKTVLKKLRIRKKIEAKLALKANEARRQTSITEFFS